MEIVKKIGLRAGMLAIILVLANWIYEQTFWKKDLVAGEGKILTELIQAQDSADVVYMGESSNFTYDKKDSVQKTICEFTADYFPRLQFKQIQKGAIHAGTFLALLKHLKDQRRLQTVVITMNLRSFDAAWIHSKLETSLARTNILFQQYPPLLNRFLLSLNAYTRKTEKQSESDMLAQLTAEVLVMPDGFAYKTAHEWDAAMANGGWRKDDKSWDMPKIELACHYIKTYAFQIHPETNPRVKDFDDIVKLCEKKKLHLVFNLLAENIEYADSLVGKDLIFLLKQNRDFLVKRYQQGEVQVVDNLEQVCGKDFIDKNWTTEHYVQNGRMRIAQNLAHSLKSIYPSDFKDLRLPIVRCTPDNLPKTDSLAVKKAIADIERRIRQTPEWLEQVKRKAIEKKISLDAMIQLDAKYVYDTDLKGK